MFKKNGTFTLTDEEKVEILSEHFQNVYNRNVTVEWAVLKEFF